MNIDHRLKDSSLLVTDLLLCQVRLNKNATFPWLMLIPRQDNIIEIMDLSPEDQIVLMEEISLTSRVIRDVFQPDKINVAALGNVVPQLHVHVVARYTYDEAWPHPIWNSGFHSEYDPDVLAQIISQLQKTYSLQEG